MTTMTNASWMAESFGSELRRDRLGRQPFRLALIEVFEREEHQRGARARHEAVDRHARELHRMLDARLMHADLADLLVTSSVRSSEAAGRQLRDRDQVLLVLLRNESARDGVEAEVREDDQTAVHEAARSPRVPHRAATAV